MSIYSIYRLSLSLDQFMLQYLIRVGLLGNLYNMISTSKEVNLLLLCVVVSCLSLLIILVLIGCCVCWRRSKVHVRVIRVADPEPFESVSLQGINKEWRNYLNSQYQYFNAKEHRPVQHIQLWSSQCYHSSLWSLNKHMYLLNAFTITMYVHTYSHIMTVIQF